MENQHNSGGRFDLLPEIPLPNSTAVIVLGIGSLVGLLCYGLPGLVMAIIALVLASGDRKLYRNNPSGYTAGSVSNLRTGRICAIVTLWVFSIFTIILIGVIVFFGFTMLGSGLDWK